VRRLPREGGIDWRRNGFEFQQKIAIRDQLIAPTSAGASENDELSRMRFHPDLLSLPAVIDARQFRRTARLQNGVQPLECFRNGVRTTQVYHSGV
jgi:hypothetical protein